MSDTTTKNVIGYLRVSTDGQVDGFGLESQKKAISDYCAEKNWAVIKWIADEGESGAKYRPGFDEIVNGAVENPPYEAVVVAKSDRVARDMYVYFYYKGALLRKNIELISVAEDFGAMGQFAHLFEAFMAVCAEIERDNINKRMTAGRNVKAAKGGYAGGRPPLGYRAVKGKLEIDEKQAEIVRFIFSDRDKYSLRGMSEYILDKYGVSVSHRSITNILDNEPFYRGCYSYGAEKGVTGDYEPILEPYKDLK